MRASCNTAKEYYNSDSSQNFSAKDISFPPLVIKENLYFQQHHLQIVILLCTVFLILGIYIGRILNQKADQLKSKTFVSSCNDSSSSLDNDGDISLLDFNKVDSTTIPGFLLIKPILDIGYIHEIEIARLRLLAICRINNTNKNEKIKNSYKSLHLMPSGLTSTVWTSSTMEDGNIIRASLIVKENNATVLKWLINNNILTGLERIFDSSIVIESSYGGSIVIKRISCKSGSFSIAKRDFIVITSTSRLADESFMITSRSINIPMLTSQQTKKNVNGFCRGVIYASGFILRSIKTNDGTVGCEIFFAVHLDMLGSQTGSVNSSKIDKMSSSIVSIMESIDKGFNMIITKSKVKNVINKNIPVLQVNIASNNVDNHVATASNSNFRLLYSKSTEDEENDLLESITRRPIRQMKLNYNQTTGIHMASQSAVHKIRQLYQSFPTEIISDIGNNDRMSGKDMASDSWKYPSGVSEVSMSARGSETDLCQAYKLAKNKEGNSFYEGNGNSEHGSGDGSRKGNYMNNRGRSNTDNSGRNNSHVWNLLHKHDDIQVYESESATGGVGVFSVHCYIQVIFQVIYSYILLR